MTSRTTGLRFQFPVLLAAFVMLVVWCAPAYAGEGQVIHVGDATEFVLDGGPWSLDRSASRQAHLVSVKAASVSGGTQRFVIKGLKTGQAELVFRNGGKIFRAHLDLLN